MVERVASFVADGERVVVGPEDVTVEEPGGLRVGIAVDGGGGDDRGDVDVGAIAVDGGALLGETIVVFGDLVEAVAVKRNSHEEFLAWNAGCEVGLDGVGDGAA